MSSVIWAALVAVNASAGPRTAGALKTELKEGSFQATVAEGFHFNEKAPNSLVLDGKRLKPARLEKRDAQWTGLPAFASGRASLYVCDDALTFCETEHVELKSAGAAKPAPAPAKAKAGKPNKHGFLEDDYAGAVARAKKENKPLLIDFSARWCPGCVRLEKEILDLPEFKALTKDYVKVKLDVDRFENGVVGGKFDVHGIPTLLVATPAQEEVGRIYDYQPMEVIRPFLESVQSDPAPIAELRRKAESKDPELLRRLGRRLMYAQKNAEAIEALSGLSPAPPELQEAKVALGMKEKKPELLREAIAALPDTANSLYWRWKLMSLLEKPEEKLAVMNEGVALADAMLDGSRPIKQGLPTDTGEYTGFETLMVASYRAYLVGAAGAPEEESRAAWNKAADVGLGLNIPLDKPGANLRLLIVLNSAKRWEDADALARRLLARYPGDPELRRRRLSALIGLKKYDEAVAEGRRALKEAFERNEFWVAQALAKAYVESGRAKDARELIDRYLAREEADWANMKDTRKALEELRKKAEG